MSDSLAELMVIAMLFAFYAFLFWLVLRGDD